MEKVVFDVERYRGPIRNWWVGLIVGLISIAMGVIVLMNPGESYLTLSMLFGVGILVAGILDLYAASTMHTQSGKGWIIATGIIEILLGVLLMFLPMVSMGIMPFLLAFWLLFRGFTLIGVSSDMIAWGIRGPGWVIALAVLMIICAFIVMFNPVVGIGAIVIWLGASFMLLGIAAIVLAFDLNTLRKHLR